MILDTYEDDYKNAPSFASTKKTKSEKIPSSASSKKISTPSTSSKDSIKIPLPELPKMSGKASVTIQAKDREKITKYLSCHQISTDPIYKRLSAIMALSNGATFRGVSTSLGVAVSTVKGWCDRYEKRGLNGLMSMKYHHWKE